MSIGRPHQDAERIERRHAHRHISVFPWCFLMGQLDGSSAPRGPASAAAAPAIVHVARLRRVASVNCGTALTLPGLTSLQRGQNVKWMMGSGISPADSERGGLVTAPLDYAVASYLAIKHLHGQRDFELALIPVSAPWMECAAGVDWLASPSIGGAAAAPRSGSVEQHWV
jgi:hypothetical protein